MQHIRQGSACKFLFFPHFKFFPSHMGHAPHDAGCSATPLLRSQWPAKEPPLLRLCLAVYKSTPIHMVWEGLTWNLCANKQALTGVNNCRDAAWFYATICRSFVLQANYSVSVVKQADATHIELNYLSVPPPSL
jgi:hypothetical protein